MSILIAGLVLFLGIHSVRMLVPDWRLARMAALGEGAWKGAYSLVSLAGLVLIVWGYARAQPLAPVLYVTPFWTVHVAIPLMAFAFVSMMVANLRAGRLKPLLKHPFLLSIKTWAFAHLMVNGDLASVVLFGGFLAWAVWNRIAVGKRRDPLPAAGPVRNDVIAVASGLAIWAAFIWKAHEWVAGVPVPLG